ncbi:nucleotidyltransferase domain-containing protein [Candidatus Bipolaricaulota bacterium]|nr:nucleotidyltransferase domain-containing protein [Candidatus Bipolaricaulota bacterium]
MERTDTGTNKEPLLNEEEERKLREELEKDDKILALYLYGSRSSGKQGPRSDTDIAMLLSDDAEEDQYSKYRLKYLSKLKKYFPSDLDFVILNQVPPLLQFQVLQGGELLYDPDPDRRALLEVKILNRYYLSKRFYEYHFENLKKRIKEQGLGHGQKRDRSATEEVRRLSEKLAKVSGSQPD